MPDCQALYDFKCDIMIPFEQRNFHKELLKELDIIAKEEGAHVLLHSCCAPCSTVCIELLSQYMPVTVFYYNPNIDDEAEYRKRVEEEIRFIKEFPTKHKVDFIEGKHDVESFYRIAAGREDCKEGGQRCFMCYRLRLEETAKVAQSLKIPYFATTLTLSPMKKSFVLNKIGLALERFYDVKYLCSDFKKAGGFKRSLELSEQYCLYRQNFCGCKYSKTNEN